jgi:hypothetical protein
MDLNWNLRTNVRRGAYADGNACRWQERRITIRRGLSIKSIEDEIHDCADWRIQLSYLRVIGHPYR